MPVCTMDVDISLCDEVACEMEVQLGGLQKHSAEGLHTPPIHINVSISARGHDPQPIVDLIDA